MSAQWTAGSPAEQLSQAMEAPASSPRRAVICVDGIVTALLKNVTPSISWEDYVRWLRIRRPDLEIVHLAQPHDWVDILSGRAAPYSQLVDSLVDAAVARLDPRWDQLVVMGFSLGGLTALRVAHEVARKARGFTLDYFAFVTMGSPFSGTGRLLDGLLRRMPLDYFNQMFNPLANRQLIRELMRNSKNVPTRMLIGAVHRDEIVRETAALLPGSWMEELSLDGDFQWDTFKIRTGNLLRAHDGLLHDPIAVAYIDGLVDGLFEPTTERPYDAFAHGRERLYYTVEGLRQLQRQWRAGRDAG